MSECRLTRGSLIACFLFCIAVAGASQAEEENLSALAKPVCEVAGLTVVPPSPWYSVPIEADEEIVEGCQMIWEQGEQYMGIMRLVSFDYRQRPEQLAEWENHVIAFEAVVMARMGITLGEPIWKRDSVPVSGNGFGNGKAIGLKASLEGVDVENEVHFMLFESATHKYVISSLTPSQATSPDVYAANTGAMGAVMRTLQPR